MFFFAPVQNPLLIPLPLLTQGVRGKVRGNRGFFLIKISLFSIEIVMKKQERFPVRLPPPFVTQEGSGDAFFLSKFRYFNEKIGTFPCETSPSLRDSRGQGALFLIKISLFFIENLMKKQERFSVGLPPPFVTQGGSGGRFFLIKIVSFVFLSSKKRAKCLPFCLLLLLVAFHGLFFKKTNK